MSDQKTTEQMQALLRELPSIDRLLKLPVVIELAAEYGRSLTLEALRHTLEAVRADIFNGATYVPMNAMLAQSAREWLTALLTPTLQPVINGTGVIVHTNLGRAPLSEAARSAIRGRQRVQHPGI
jgi:L-seryl-tRNA(Ser) seleniumtransferase